MPKEKLGLIDSLYLRACNLVLDYGGLALAAAGGAAMADSNAEVLGEPTRSTLVNAGIIGAAVAPGLDIGIGSGTMLHSDSPGDDALYNRYIVSQLGRNLSAYVGAQQLAEGIRNNSPINAATGLFAGGLAAAGHIIGRRAKNQLEARIRKRTLLSTQQATN